MNISEIETFLMIVKTRNISKTAENLFFISAYSKPQAEISGG